MNTWQLLARGGLLLALPLAACAAAAAGETPAPVAPAPSAAVLAELEAAGRWDEALRLYERLLAEDPQRLDLWLRVAEIEDQRGNRERVIRALRGAAACAPGDAALHYRLAQALSAADRPQEALFFCRRAVELAPENNEYLWGQAQLAGWCRNEMLAERSLVLLIERQPQHREARRNLLSIRSGRGRNLDRASREYREFLEEHPDDREAWLDYVHLESWRGNYAASFAALEQFRDLFSDEPAYAKEKSRLLAWSGDPQAALALVEPLVAADPADYELQFTRTTALHNARRPAEALENLAVLEKLRPESPDTAELRDVLRTPLRPRLESQGRYYKGSDGIHGFRADEALELPLDARTLLQAGGWYQRTRSDPGSGYERRDPADRPWIANTGGWFGLGRRFSPEFAADLRGGGGLIDEEEEFFPYRAGLDWQPRDNLAFRLQHERSLFDASPRSIELDIERDETALAASWQPGLLYFLDVRGASTGINDGNNSWSGLLQARRALARTAWYNLDLGISSTAEGYAQDRENGYWDPRLYQWHALTAYVYVKLGRQHDLRLRAALGMQKDDQVGRFERGEEGALELNLGFFSDVQLTLAAEYTHRGERGPGFEAVSGTAALIIRF